MKKLIFIPLIALTATSCTNRTESVTDRFGNVHQAMHHESDSKGAAHFPVQRAATGKKVFVFDPKATAWAAYDASGNRIKTGRASGEKLLR